MNRHLSARGFTLIELVLMIVIFTVASVGIMSAFRLNILGAATNTAGTTATRLAQQRMEMILAQRYINGWTSFADPCPAAAVCGALPAGYTIATPTIATITANVTKEITVQASYNGVVRATLVTRVTNY